ncbi:hypothetical protein CRE_23602 [Caenorhabditis remanei]|uniref:Uncharacterized protein n=1 Tax=Caenorhabditis remanei TaxID=31234 RepID=E3MVR9_CAERE|nr:hypothetical protein CRE_23602 [Caenorhabditis remanei]
MPPKKYNKGRPKKKNSGETGKPKEEMTQLQKQEAQTAAFEQKNKEYEAELEKARKELETAERVFGEMDVAANLIINHCGNMAESDPLYDVTMKKKDKAKREARIAEAIKLDKERNVAKWEMMVKHFNKKLNVATGASSTDDHE